MIKSVVKTAVALTIGAVAFVDTNPVYEKSFVKGNGESEEIVTVSWNFSNEIEKHFSVERFVDGDINDAFVITREHNYWNNFEYGYTDELEWNVWNIEFFKDVDAFWFNIEIGK